MSAGPMGRRSSLLLPLIGPTTTTHKKRLATKAVTSLSMYPRGESNPYLKFRKLPFYPLNYRGNGCSLCGANKGIANLQTFFDSYKPQPPTFTCLGAKIGVCHKLCYRNLRF